MLKHLLLLAFLSIISATSPGNVVGWLGNLLTVGETKDLGEGLQETRINGRQLNQQETSQQNRGIYAIDDRQQWSKKNKDQTFPPPPFPPPPPPLSSGADEGEGPPLLPRVWGRSSIGKDGETAVLQSVQNSVMTEFSNETALAGEEHFFSYTRPPPPPIPSRDDDETPFGENQGSIIDGGDGNVRGLEYPQGVWETIPPHPYAIMPPPRGFEYMNQMMTAQQQEQQSQYLQGPHPQRDWAQLRLPNEQSKVIQSLQSELDSVLMHQKQLCVDITNLTSALIDYEQADELKNSQIDALTERLADAESHASAESNAALEYKENCTELGNTIQHFKGQVDEWETKCSTLVESQKTDRKEIVELKAKVKERELELEELACGIEEARVGEEQQKYWENLHGKRKKNQTGGLVSWLFGWLSNREDRKYENLEKLQELAKSTLLTALQTERDNVEELEAALSVVQQNNSAIAEMVSSRDSLIDELNDRVAVFEEDKVVLKAALRQLQKEMKEEAPKTQKLVTDLKTAQSVIKNLKSEIKSLELEYTNRTEALKLKLSKKQEMMNETDSKMAMISGYVDQLEERLASFAIVRRQIAIRERKCKEIEGRKARKEEQWVTSQRQIEEVTEERDELKKLAELLVEERSVIQKGKRTLQEERDTLKSEKESLRYELDGLNERLPCLEAEVLEVRNHLEESVLKNVNHEEDLIKLQTLSDESTKKITDQEEEIRNSLVMIMSLKEKITKLQEEFQKMEMEKVEAVLLLSAVGEEVTKCLSPESLDRVGSGVVEISNNIDLEVTPPSLYKEREKQIDASYTTTSQFAGTVNVKFSPTQINCDAAKKNSDSTDEVGEEQLIHISSHPAEIEEHTEVHILSPTSDIDNGEHIIDIDLHPTISPATREEPKKGVINMNPSHIVSNLLSGDFKSKNNHDGYPVKSSKEIHNNDLTSFEVQEEDNYIGGCVLLQKDDSNEGKPSTAKSESPLEEEFPTKSVLPLEPPVPFRTVRKAFAKRTGVHGFFTRSSKSISKSTLPSKRS